MRKITTLSSILALMVVPAFAEPSHTSNEFPGDGKMLEDYRYVNQAVYDNILVYSGSVDANATYTDIDYTVAAGKYLPQSAEAVADCTSGNYCPGLQNTVNYSSSIDQGLNACPSGFGTSAVGSTAETDCYRTCDIANMGSNGTIADIPHAATLSGNDYYGAGTDTCVPATCQLGYSLANHTVYPQGTPNLMTLIGASEGPIGYGYKAYTTTGDNSDASTLSTYGITQDGEFVVDYGTKGKIHGFARCSSRAASNPWMGELFLYELQSDGATATLPDSTGRYCYCQLDGYTPSGQSMQSFSAPWVFYIDQGDATSCARGCAGVCAYNLGSTETDAVTFRVAMFNSLGVPGAPTCDANVITINWADASTADIDANSAGTMTYGGDINTPRAAVHKPGKQFVGWTFSVPESPSQEP